MYSKHTKFADGTLMPKTKFIHKKSKSCLSLPDNVKKVNLLKVKLS